jgi:hypothetical protein
MLLAYTVFVVGKCEVDTVDPLLRWRVLLLQIDDNIGPWVRTMPYVSSVG